jgi:hypothetical protein
VVRDEQDAEKESLIVISSSFAIRRGRGRGRAMLMSVKKKKVMEKQIRSKEKGFKGKGDSCSQERSLTISLMRPKRQRQITFYYTRYQTYPILHTYSHLNLRYHYDLYN